MTFQMITTTTTMKMDSIIKKDTNEINIMIIKSKQNDDKN